MVQQPLDISLLPLFVSYLPNPVGCPQLRLTLIQSNKEDQKQFRVSRLPFTLLIFCILPTFQGSLKVPALS